MRIIQRRRAAVSVSTIRYDVKCSIGEKQDGGNVSRFFQPFTYQSVYDVKSRAPDKIYREPKRRRVGHDLDSEGKQGDLSVLERRKT